MKIQHGFVDNFGVPLSRSIQSDSVITCCWRGRDECGLNAHSYPLK